jgi:hypothetical protein
MDRLRQDALSPATGVPLDGPLSKIPSLSNEHGQVIIAEAKAALWDQNADYASPHITPKMAWTPRRASVIL